ncbi:MAG: FkbM family methyltransferase [Planctomycetota bacterium]
MKPREILYTLGFKPRPRAYGFEVGAQDLGQYGQIEFARWLHPKAYDWRVYPEEITELRHFLRPGDLCVDVGAHCGDTAAPMGLAVGAEGCVVALEPNRYLFPVLEENSRLLAERATIVPVMAAATPEPGTYTFGYSDPGFCNGGDDHKLTWWRRRRMFPLEVTGLRLEELLREQYADRLDRLRYIKTDTEGNDLELLKSIRGLLADCRPFLRVEVYRFCPADYRAELHRYLTELGYSVHATNSISDLAGPELSADGVVTMGHGDVFCIPSEAATEAVTDRAA